MNRFETEAWMDGSPHVVLITDHSSTEGSREYLIGAVKHCTGGSPVLIDAQNFLPDGAGQIRIVQDGVQINAPLDDCSVMASTVIVYEIPPERRPEFGDFQRELNRHGVWPLGTDPEPWRVATEKDLTVDRFRRCDIPHAQTITLDRPGSAEALHAFQELGGNVWARPAVGMGGEDVFHITSADQLRRAIDYYDAAGRKWLIARDALNFNASGKRHQFRILVLDDTAIQVCEHVQEDPDLPCNEYRGAAVTLLDPEEWPADLCELAIAATRALGLRFSGVDLAMEGGGVVFEVNVHPGFSPGSLHETVAIPYVMAHLGPQHRAA